MCCPDVSTLGRLHSRLKSCNRLPEISPEEDDYEAALQVFLGDYSGALRACRASGLRAALLALVEAFPAAEKKSMAFFPRRQPRRQDRMLVSDGAVSVEHGAIRGKDGVELGYVYMAPAQTSTSNRNPGLVLHWGGNAEFAAQAPSSPFCGLVAGGGFHTIFADYRGYGWSSGQASVSCLHEDVASLLEALPELVARHGRLGWPLQGPLVLMGRSVGALCALGAALRYTELVTAVVLDAPVACQWPYEQVPAELWEGLARELPAALRVAKRQMHCDCCQGSPVKAQPQREALCFDPVDVAACLDLPLLLIGGTADVLCPRLSLQALFDAWKCEEKEVLWLPGLGHNELRGSRDFWAKLSSFLDLAAATTASQGEAGEAQGLNGREAPGATGAAASGRGPIGWCRKRLRP